MKKPYQHSIAYSLSLSPFSDSRGSLISSPKIKTEESIFIQLLSCHEVDAQERERKGKMKIMRKCFGAVNAMRKTISVGRKNKI
jgi:hypothetical protein